MVLPFALNHINLWLLSDEMEDPHLLWFGGWLQRWLGPDTVYRFSAPAR